MGTVIHAASAPWCLRHPAWPPLTRLCAPHDLHPSPCHGHVPFSPSLSPSIGGGHSGPQHQGGVCPGGASTRPLPLLCVVTQLAQEYLGGERHRVGKHSCYLFVIWYLFFMLLGNGRWGLVGQEVAGDGVSHGE